MNKDKLIEDLWMQELDPYNDYEQIKGVSVDYPLIWNLD